MLSHLRLGAVSLVVISGVALACAPAQARRDPADRSTVTEEDLANSTDPIETVLQKKVSGIIVTRTGDGGIALQIRGTSSFRGDATPPLYVLNGLPFQPGPDGALTGVDPYAIESIKVLRDAEAALYGIQGANGVIIITTKKPVKTRR